MNCLLSICIPTFNRASIVTECVKNCLAYDIDWIEVAVTDNCSTDDTYVRLQKIKDARFHYYRNDKNIGYGNLMQCMKNGNGKFCLLLSDEDALFHVDWIELEQTLKQADEITVFQCRYFDEHQREIISGPSKRFECDTFDGYSYAKTHFMYAGGTILKKEALEQVWDDIDKSSYLWSLYCEIIVPFCCVRYGCLDRLNCLSTVQTKRNNTGTIDAVALNGLEKEPYWVLTSRRKQFTEWFDVLASMHFADDCRKKLLLQNRYQAIYSVYHFFSMIHSESFANNPLAKKNPTILERDLKLRAFDWIKRLSKEKRIMNSLCKNTIKAIDGGKNFGACFDVRFSVSYLTWIGKILIKNFIWKVKDIIFRTCIKQRGVK